MSKFSSRLKELRVLNDLSQQKLANLLKTSKSSINMYERGEREPGLEMLENIADFFNVDMDYLMGKSNIMNKACSINSESIFTDDVVTFPVIGEVAAGFDSYASENFEIRDYADFPRRYLQGRTTKDFFVLQIIGMSMYPMYIPGDVVLVKRTPVADNGQVAIVQYDDYATIKKIEKGSNSIKLIPLNPNYPPEEKEGTDLDNLHILGVPVCLLRETEK